MTLHHNGATLHAAAFTGTPGGIFAWETEKCALSFGVHVALEIVPDEKPEIELLAGRMASALAEQEAKRN